MQGSDLALLGFLVTVLGVVIALWLNISLARRKVERWDLYSTLLFVMSVGNFGAKQREMWKRKAGYEEQEANVIIRYQALCLLEIPLGFIASAIFAYWYTRP